MSSKRGLGRGLNAIIPTVAVQDNDTVSEISLQDIVPNRFQPRRVFDPEKLAELSDSIRQYGVVQPVIVRKTVNCYELVAGELRMRASQMAGCKTIPAVVRDYTDSEMTEIALIENLQRQDLNPMEEALAFRKLMTDFGLTQEEVAVKIGRSRSLIANIVRLLNLQPVVQEHVSRGTLTIGQARPLLAIEQADTQIEAANTIIENDLSARDAEELVRRMLTAPKNKKKAKTVVKQELFIAEAEDQLKMLLGAQVKIKPGKLKSKIEIEFSSADDLERIIETLAAPLQAAAVKNTNSFIV